MADTLPFFGIVSLSSQPLSTYHPLASSSIARSTTSVKNIRMSTIHPDQPLFIVPARGSSGDRLSRLPEELLCIIADFSLQAVLKLRLTCAAIQQKTRKIFIDKYIAHRYVWIDSDSLTSTLGLAQDNGLAPCVKSLTVHLNQWHTERNTPPVFPQPDPLHWAGIHEKNANEERDYQNFLLESGKAASMLSQIIKRLPNLQDVALRNMQKTDESWPITHFRYLEHDYLHRTGDRSRFTRKVWFGVIQAIIDNELGLHTLDALAFLPKQSVGMLSGRTLTALAPSLANLNALLLNIQLPFGWDERETWEVTLTSLLWACQNVGRLHLDFSSEHEELVEDTETDPEYSIDSIGKWPTFQRVIDLSFSGLDTNALAFAVYLQKHTKTVKVFEMGESELRPTDGGWRIVLQSLLDFDLDDFYFKVRESYNVYDSLHAKGPGIKTIIETALTNGLTRESAWWARPREDPDEDDSSSASSSEQDQIHHFGMLPMGYFQELDEEMDDETDDEEIEDDEEETDDEESEEDV